MIESQSANVTSVQILPVGDKWEAALKDVRAVIADAEAAPPTQAEIDREYADYDVATEECGAKPARSRPAPSRRTISPARSTSARR